MTDLTELTKKLDNLQKSLDELAAVQRAALLPPSSLFTFIYDDQPVRMFLPNAAHDFIQKTILRTASFYEAPLLKQARKSVPRGSTVIDAGGNIGNHAIFFSMFCGARTVHTFEPQRYAFSLMNRNIVENGIKNVVMHNAAVGAAATRANLTNHLGSNFGATTFSFNSNGEYEVKSIDSLDLGDVGFIKIDVEGAQMAVLEGASKTIEKFRPPAVSADRVCSYFVLMRQ